MYIIIIVLLIIMVVLLWSIHLSSEKQTNNLYFITKEIESIKLGVNHMEDSLIMIHTHTRLLDKIENHIRWDNKRQIELLEKIESNTCEDNDDFTFPPSGNAKEQIIELLEKIESNTCEDNTNL